MCFGKYMREKARIEAKYEVEKSEKEMYKKLYYDKNDTDRALIKMIQEFESQNTCGIAGYRDLVRRIKDELVPRTEKKFSDKILSKNSFS